MRAGVRINRTLKSWGFRLGVDRLLLPMSGALITLGNFARLARWARDHRPLPYSDRNNPKVVLDKRFELYEHVFRSEGLEGALDYLEFGVAAGASLTWWTRRNRDPESRFFGFDSFTGLPENWGGFAVGTFSTEGRPPRIDDPRCAFLVGLFQETLGPFLDRVSLGRRLVIHADADLYSSTLFVLTRMAPLLKAGDILLFDEFGVPAHEFRAFEDFVAAYRLRYRVLGAVNNYLQVALRVE